MCLLLLSVHAAFTITDYRQKYCISVDGETVTFRTNQRLFHRGKEQNAVDSRGYGLPPACASTPESRASAHPKTCCMQVATRPGRYSEIGQETLIDRVIYN